MHKPHDDPVRDERFSHGAVARTAQPRSAQST